MFTWKTAPSVCGPANGAGRQAQGRGQAGKVAARRAGEDGECAASCRPRGVIDVGAPRSQGTAAASALAGCSHCVGKKKSRGQAGSPSRQAHLASGKEVGGESSSCSLPGPGDAQPPPERTPVSPCHPTLRCSSLPCPTGSCHQHRKPLGRSGRFPHSPFCIHSMFSPVVARSLAGGLGSAGTLRAVVPPDASVSPSEN